MIFGRVSTELIQLNEATLWSGGPVSNDPTPGAANALPDVRAALFRQDYTEAAKQVRRIQGVYTEAYQPLGDLLLRQTLAGDSSAYYRDLNVSTATATTRFTSGGVTYTRELFVSAPDQVIVVRLTANRKGALNLTAALRSLHPVRKTVVGPMELAMRGKSPAKAVPNYVDYDKKPVRYDDSTGCNGTRFDLRLRIRSTDGQVTADTAGLHIRGASEAVLYLVAATSFNGFDKCPDRDGRDEQALVDAYLKRVLPKSVDAIWQAHIRDYQSYANRVSLTLNGTTTGTVAQLPTDERLKRYAQGSNDPTLESLYFEYDRYLLISSSRTTAANLQGIWNPMVRPPWSSNYTININTEMNYWPAEVTNLSELHRPLLDLIGSVAVTGRNTARTFYGAGGWVAHHNTDIWGASNPVGDRGKGDPNWANWAMGGNWLCQHLWEHYQFTGDKNYLRTVAYPLMKEAAQFCVDFLVESPEGRLVTAPATSPENIFITENGQKEAVSVATTMDMGIIWDLFSNVEQAAQQLNTDADFRLMLAQKKQKLFPLQIGKAGDLQEWYHDWSAEDPQHRHVSHLFVLHPGREISPLTTPNFAAAARKTLEIRGDGGTGWSKAWKINFWARLHDGNHAYKLLRELLRLTGVEGTEYAKGGGTYPNLLCAHPPFQIDGNFGGLSGMSEMLLQSQDGLLNLLPACPDAWASGQVRGLKARGGYTLDMDWQKGRLTRLVVQSAQGGICRLRLPGQVRMSGKNQLKAAQGVNPNSFYQLPASAYRTRQPNDPTPGYSVYDLPTEPGKTYVLLGQ